MCIAWMLDSKRLLTVASQLVLLGTTVLVFVLSLPSARASTALASTALGGLVDQNLRQAIGFRAQSLRRASSTQQRVSRLVPASAVSERSLPSEMRLAGCAFESTRPLALRIPVRVLPDGAPSSAEELVSRIGVAVARARGPPLSSVSWLARHIRA